MLRNVELCANFFRVRTGRRSTPAVLSEFLMTTRGILVKVRAFLIGNSILPLSTQRSRRRNRLSERIFHDDRWTGDGRSCFIGVQQSGTERATRERTNRAPGAHGQKKVLLYMCPAGEGFGRVFGDSVDIFEKVSDGPSRNNGCRCAGLPA
jgi:hypothetical protein